MAGGRAAPAGRSGAEPREAVELELEPEGEWQAAGGSRPLRWDVSGDTGKAAGGAGSLWRRRRKRRAPVPGAGGGERRRGVHPGLRVAEGEPQPCRGARRPAGGQRPPSPAAAPGAVPAEVLSGRGR